MTVTVRGTSTTVVFVGEIWMLESVGLMSVTVNEPVTVALLLPLVMFAVSVKVPAVLLVAAKTACPLGLVTALLDVMLLTPESVTVAPCTGRPLLSTAVTVTVLLTLTATLVGETFMVEKVLLSVTALSVSVGVSVCTLAFLTAVAEMVKVPTAVGVTVKMATPVPLVVTVPPSEPLKAGVLESVTWAPETGTPPVSITVTVTVTGEPITTFAVVGVIVERAGAICVKSSVADGVMVTLLATAVSVAVPGVLLVTSKVALPFTSVVGLTGVIVSTEPRSLVSVTLRP